VEARGDAGDVRVVSLPPPARRGGVAASSRRDVLRLTMAKMRRPRSVANSDEVRITAINGAEKTRTRRARFANPWYLREGLAFAQSLPANSDGVAWPSCSARRAHRRRNFVRFFQEYYSDKAATNGGQRSSPPAYDHVLHIPLGFFGRKGKPSDVTSRLVQDSQGLQEGFKSVLGQSIQEPIKAAFAFCPGALAGLELTLFIVRCLGPLMFCDIKKVGKIDAPRQPQGAQAARDARISSKDANRRAPSLRPPGADDSSGGVTPASCGVDRGNLRIGPHRRVQHAGAGDAAFIVVA